MACKCCRKVCKRLIYIFCFPVFIVIWCWKQWTLSRRKSDNDVESNAHGSNDTVPRIDNAPETAACQNHESGFQQNNYKSKMVSEVRHDIESNAHGSHEAIPRIDNAPEIAAYQNHESVFQQNNYESKVVSETSHDIESNAPGSHETIPRIDNAPEIAACQNQESGFQQNDYKSKMISEVRHDIESNAHGSNKTVPRIDNAPEIAAYQNQESVFQQNDFNSDKPREELEENANQIFDQTPEQLHIINELDKRNKELSAKIEDQRRMQDSLKLDKEQTVSDESDDEEIRKMKEAFQERLAEQNKQSEEELKAARQRRAEVEREREEEIRQLREKFNQQMQAMVLCIQLQTRFEEKEEEWSNIMDRIRRPLIKVMVSVRDIDDEFQRSKNNMNNVTDVIAEVKSLGRLVGIAQDVLFNAYGKLKELSEDYVDKIFLRIIMKAVSLEGQKCDLIGNKLLTLLESPLNHQLQKELLETVSTLNHNSIPTTKNLKIKASTARMENFENIAEVPFPDWFSEIQS